MRLSSVLSKPPKPLFEPVDGFLMGKQGNLGQKVDLDVGTVALNYYCETCDDLRTFYSKGKLTCIFVNKNMVSISLAIKTSKLTAEVLQKAMKALLAKGKGQLTKAPHGKITMRQLMKPGEKVSNIEITDQNIKAFDPIARKNGLDYNVKKIENGKPPTYLVSFKGKDIDVMTEAFREFTAKKLGRDKKPSIRKLLSTLKDKAAALNAQKDKVKKKDREVSL